MPLFRKLSNTNLHTEKIAIVRMILALGTLMTLLFNDINLLAYTDYLYDAELMRAANANLLGLQMSLFKLFSPVVGKIVSICILILVISGYFPQVTSFLHAWVNISITNSLVPIDGGDQIAANLSLFLIPICLTDPRINQWNTSKPSNAYINVFANVTFFFIQLQAAIIYLQSGIGKMYTEEWKEGTAAFYWLSHPIHGAPDWLRSILEPLTLSNYVFLVTWAVMVFEVFLFSCIFANKRVKSAFLAAAIGFHFSIFVIHGLFSFFFSMFALLLIYLDDANHFMRIFYRIKNFYLRCKTISILPHLIAERS